MLQMSTAKRYDLALKWMTHSVFGNVLNRTFKRSISKINISFGMVTLGIKTLVPDPSKVSHYNTKPRVNRCK